MTKKVLLNEKQCEGIAQRISPLRLRSGHQQRPFLSCNAAKETKLRGYLISAAICHQTHTLINSEKNLKGWVYIEEVFTNLTVNNSPFLEPSYVLNCSSEKLIDELKTFFVENNTGSQCNLDRLEERVNFIIQINQVLQQKYDGLVSNLLNESNGWLIGDNNGLYNLLQDFEAYRDPFKKKSTLFIQLASESGLFEIKDLESIEPMMDYHMQRVLLRTGCVEIVDESLKKTLQNKEKISSDEEIRGVAIEAVKLISKFSNKNFFELDEILWSLGRSCCKEKMLCIDKICNKKPCTFFSNIAVDNHDSCLFDGICFGSSNESYRKYWQPIIDTNYY